MRIYLAGPMSGLPSFNYPAFIEAGGRLRKLGFDVVSPAELDASNHPEDYKAAIESKDGATGTTQQTWGDFLARDVKLLADGGIEGIVFLPNWFRSRGAKLEATVGLLNGFQFWEYRADLGIAQRDKEWVKSCLSAHL